MGVDFRNCNFADLAQTMGAKGVRREDSANVEEALREALAHKDGPVVVDAVVDPYALSIPSHVPERVARGFIPSGWHQIWHGDGELVAEEVESNLPLLKEAATEGVL